MDDTTRRYWEQIADRCIDRAFESALTAVTLLTPTTISAKEKHLDGHQDTTIQESSRK